MLIKGFSKTSFTIFLDYLYVELLKYEIDLFGSGNTPAFGGRM